MHYDPTPGLGKFSLKSRYIAAVSQIWLCNFDNIFAACVRAAKRQLRMLVLWDHNAPRSVIGNVGHFAKIWLALLQLAQALKTT